MKSKSGKDEDGLRAEIPEDTTYQNARTVDHLNGKKTIILILASGLLKVVVEFGKVVFWIFFPKEDLSKKE